MKDIFNNNIFIKVFASGKPLKAHVLAVTRLSDDEVAKSINEIIEENEITYEDIMPPRNKNKGSYKLSMKTKHLIEEKMEDIGIEIFIFGFLTTNRCG
ncbi:hypothetical protein KAU33_02515 [Candidatus Dependentiae bacterium]|nr:hypothetical protein [Candidatus Dependentiae bacterium]